MGEWELAGAGRELPSEALSAPPEDPRGKALPGGQPPEPTEALI